MSQNWIFSQLDRDKKVWYHVTLRNPVREAGRPFDF